MTKRRIRLGKALWLAVGSLVILSVVVYVAIRLSETTTPQSETTNSNGSGRYVPLSNASPTRLVSADELSNYIQRQRAALPESSLSIDDTDLQIVWSQHDIIAVEYSLYTARTIESVLLQEVDSRQTIVITVKEPPSGCLFTQVNKLHILFVTVPKDNKEYPVAQRIIPNSATCDVR